MPAKAHVALLQKMLGGLSAAAAGLLIPIGIGLLLPHGARRAALVFRRISLRCCHHQLRLGFAGRPTCQGRT